MGADAEERSTVQVAYVNGEEVDAPQDPLCDLPCKNLLASASP